MKYFLSTAIFLGFILCGMDAHAQDNMHRDHTTQNVALPKNENIDDGSIKEKDMVDVARTLFNKRGERTDKSSLHLSALPAAGYAQQTGFAGVVSANLAFHTGYHNHEQEKISTIQTSFAYSQYNQVILPLQAGIWTKNNQFNLIVDWRYLKYPSQTFGLGGRSNINNGYTINFNYVKLHQALLKKVTENLYAGLGLHYDHFWNVDQVDPPAGVITDFQRYGFSNTVTAVGPAFRLLFDSRRNQINPSNCWYANVIYRPNYKSLGSDDNWKSLLTEVRTYFRVPSSSHNVLALWSYNWITPGSVKTPYLLLPSTGWDDFYNTGRGYIQGRYRGRNMIYFESEYRFRVTDNGLLGAVVFANAQSFSRELSKEFAVIVPAFGAGIRIKLNKFSGTNVAIDYGIGVDGSKGIAVNLGEVF